MTDPLPQTLHFSPVPFITLPNWVKAAQACGFNIEPLFRQIGIETNLLQLESVTIDPPKLLFVMEACVAEARAQPPERRRHFPFVLGETFAFDYLPEIQTFLTTSGSLRETLRVFEWLQELVNPRLRGRVEEQDDLGRLILDIGEVPRPYFIETAFAVVLKFVRSLLPAADVRELAFRHPPPDYAEEYQRFFGCPVRFDAPQHAIVFPASLLDVPLAGAFPALNRQAEVRLSQRMAKAPRTAPASIVTAIEQAFTDKPQLLRRSVEDLAVALNLSARTLQRRLGEEGHGYTELRARAQFAQASRWLEAGEPGLDEIAERLGFSDRRSFTRAFQRWSGLSPSAYRRNATSRTAESE